ncbi:MAG: alpha/beta hydrolase [Rhodoferax sp.]|uniref:alpha/beta hydrolase n=1 Tax=Rhodoferax sp. TaxID=50421 RepID=UPI00262D8587|nr:alpha/beta hydrolase [Rhodoferax sp.]MDD2879073.1 alpha/beta hydrolase [Rhodoferax sp.]
MKTQITQYLHSLAAALALIASMGLTHAGELFKVPTRPDIRTTVFWHATEGATATLLVFPGGGGGFGKVEDGWPTSNNFLVRTARLWAAQGFNLAIFGRPNDSAELGYEDRISDKHMADAKAVLDWVKRKSPAPVWIMGTSRGTVSTAAMLINIQDTQIAGGVVSSSVVEYKYAGALPRQDLPMIKVPVLVYHHERDECHACRPHEVPSIISGLKGSPVKRLMMVSGGADPKGNPCEANHWHGFIGMEPQAVLDISDWIRKPTAK